MPFIRVGYLQDQYEETELPMISQNIMSTLIEHFNVPPDDYFQVFHAHKRSEFFYSRNYLNIPRTDRLLYIQVTLGSGRTRDQKCRFYQTLAERLTSQCNVRKEDVFAVLVETELEDWTFGNGQAQMIR